MTPNPPPTEPPKQLLAVQPSTPETPGAGGWVPKPTTVIAVAVFVGMATASMPALMAPEFNVRYALASAIGGAASALATYFGMRSAGPRTPQ